MVIVSDKYLEAKSDGKVQGLVRVVLYLEDLGVVKKQSKAALPQLNAPMHGSNTVED